MGSIDYSLHSQSIHNNWFSVFKHNATGPQYTLNVYLSDADWNVCLDGSSSKEKNNTGKGRGGGTEREGKR